MPIMPNPSNYPVLEPWPTINPPPPILVVGDVPEMIVEPVETPVFLPSTDTKTVKEVVWLQGGTTATRTIKEIGWTVNPPSPVLGVPFDPVNLQGRPL